MNLINEIRPTMNENDNSFTLLVIKDLGFKGKKIGKILGRFLGFMGENQGYIVCFFYCF